MVNEAVKEAVEEQYDQSLFDSNQSILQAPPRPPMSEEQIKVAKKRKIILASVVIFFLLVIVMVMVTPRKSSVKVGPTPEPSPTPSIQQTEMQQQLQSLGNGIATSDPEKTLLSPPQVDMQVEF